MVRAVARSAVLSWVGWLALVGGCAADEGGAFTDHDEGSDFMPFDGTKADGVSDSFLRNDVMSDALFESTALVSVEGVQAFLENTPYGRRCFLADAQLGGQSAAEAIVAAAETHGISPLLLLVRMQVEKGLIGKSTAPSQKSVDYAFGCGCHDGRACDESFKGFAKQLDCAASTLREHFDAAAEGGGIWSVGVAKKTLDELVVTPANAATASLYAYTPWVLEGKGGNWLVWNVSGRYLAHMEDRKLTDGVEGSAFVGTPCDPEDSASCAFTEGSDEGFCHAFSSAGESLGMCSLDCEGLCPDRSATDTMCVELEAGRGSCVPLAAAGNDDCAAIPGTEPVQMDRFVGSSGVGPRTELVCVPAEGGAGTGPSCAGLCGSDTAVPDGQGNACFCDDLCASKGDCCPDHETVCG
jgi:hypothetical protein